MKTDLVQDINLEDEGITIKVDLKSDHQFANNIREEIQEKLEPIHDIKEVEVTFTR